VKRAEARAPLTTSNPAVLLDIQRQPGANIIQTADLVKALLPKLRAAALRKDQQFRPIPVDLADPSDIDRGIKVCLREFDGIDILVNNAAIQGPIGPLECNDWQQWRQAFKVNLFAPARLCQLLIPALRRRGGGKIINLSGGGATSPRPDFSSYAAAKCALVRLTETLAQESSGDRIDVNAVAPGAMNTRMLDEVLAAGPDAAPREFAQALKRKRDGGASMEKAVGLVAMLASSLSDGISGKLISAVWDDWERLPAQRDALSKSEIYTLRRIMPKEPEASDAKVEPLVPRKAS